MSISFRFFLFAPDGLQRISQRRLSDLVDGREAMPQFAHQKLKLAQVAVLLQDRKAHQISKVYGTYLDFDHGGMADKAFAEASTIALNLLDHSSFDIERRKRAKVVDVTPLLERKKYDREHRWTPSRQDLDLIARAVFEKGGRTRQTRLKGSSALQLYCSGRLTMP
jgi:hypothetical protein